MGGKVTLAFSSTLGHQKPTLITPPAISPEVLASGPQASEPSDSRPSATGFPALRPPAHGHCALRKRQCGQAQQERECYWLRASFN